jgi:S1-C subfamily serine protease
MSDQINQLVDDLNNRRIDRRGFMNKATALGLSSAAIAALTGQSVAAQEGEGAADPTAGAQLVGANVLAQLSEAMANAVERAGAGTVTVYARQRMPGSGIVWTADGLVVSANHVVERDEDITVGLPDGRTVEATLVGRDPGSDIAILRIEATDLTPAPRSDATARIGNLVLAVGRPGDSGPMASFGGVSVVGGSWRTALGGTIDGFIRADVAMLPGFSGGPLVDAEGGILGLNSSTLGRGGGFTIPVKAVDAVVTSLLTHGKVRRGFLGVAAQAARLPGPLAEELGRERGLLIVGLEEDGPAERDGLLVGDLIVALDGGPVSESDELQARLAGDWVGKAIPVKVVRGGQFHEVAVTIGERPDRAQPEDQPQRGWRRGPSRG